MFRRLLLSLGALALVAFGILQAIPYGRNHTNPPVRQEPQWDSPQTRQLAVRACFDCHSNQTVWPWYSYIAPVSWLVYRDVMEGRAALNFSEWDRPQEGEDAVEAIQKGSMPPRLYTLIQSKARLSSQETQALIQGLRATLGGGGEGQEGGGEEEGNGEKGEED